MKKKLRGDSTFSKLSPEQLAEVEDMFASGCTYEDVQKHLADLGVKASRTSIAEYYHNHVQPARWARQRRLALRLDTSADDAAALDAATLTAVRQMVMELAFTPGGDAKTLRMLYDLILKARTLGVDERRLALAEKKAAAADETKALLEARKAEGGLTPEALALAEEALNLL